MANFSGPNFEFADDSPVRSGRKHRRGRGYLPSKGGNSSRQHAQNSGSYGGHQAQSGSKAGKSSADYIKGQPHQQQTHYYTSSWDSTPTPPSKNNKDQDNNSCTGSLTYSASSSVQSGMSSSGGESSNDSSFADIIKLIDSEGEGASEIKAFIAARSEAASSEGGVFGGRRDGSAVAGWMQRVDARSREKQQQKKQASKQSRRTVSSNNVDFNYSKDDSDDGYFKDNVLETITGRDEDAPRRSNITVTTRSQGDPFPTKPNPGNQGDNLSVSTPRASPSSGAVTPPPDSRNKRLSTPPPSLFGQPAISRSNSHRSKSSSDGSWDTPTKSPPHGNPYSKPPQASFTTKKRSGKGGGSPRGGSTSTSIQDVGDISEAVYKNFWMCGFTDAFNFDKLEKK